jgi:8-oxo-dGTP pyrophosphatase MutT (NUDIX family)
MSVVWRPEYAAGVLACARSTGRCLLARRSDNGLWSVPGGHIELGEDSLQAAVREFEEETGRRVRACRDLGVVDGFRVFLSEVPSEFRPRLDHEHTAYRWEALRGAGAPLPRSRRLSLPLTSGRW